MGKLSRELGNSAEFDDGSFIVVVVVEVVVALAAEVVLVDVVVDRAVCSRQQTPTCRPCISG